MYIHYILLLSIISLSTGSNQATPYLDSINSTEFNNSVHILAIMAEFKEDDDPRTTGNGKFLSSTEENIYYYNQSEKRCEGFLIDPPPHNKEYFEDQIKAAESYYLNISNNQINFTYDVLETVYQLDKTMIEYSEISSYNEPNESIAQLFVDALEKANSDINNYLEQNGLNASEILIVVFHAGVGEDYGFDGYLDPANYDIRSAYIDSEIASFFPDSINITKGILLPETLNLIYYNTIEDIYGYQGQGLCDIQIGMTGLFTYLLGYEFGLPEMFNRDTGETGLGVFELMDIGSFNGRGVIPSPPQAWSRIKAGWEAPLILDTPSTSYIQNINRFSQSGTGLSVHRINISSDEYLLIESVDNKIIKSEDDYDISEISYLDTVLSINIPNTLTSIFDRLLYLDGSIPNIIEYGDECIDNAKITISSSTGVVLCAKNYDYGLPGSGMMIWHVNERNVENLNDDIENKTIKLLEADGAQDIGYENYFYPMANPSVGWKWDLWFEDNEAYFSVNSERNTVGINSYTTPSTHSSSGARSLISITNIKKGNTPLSIKFKFNDENDIFSQFFIAELENSTTYCIGGQNNTLLFDMGDGVCHVNNLSNFTCSDYSNYPSSYQIGDFIYLDSNSSIISCSEDSYFDLSNQECSSLDGYIPKGYFTNSNTLEELPEYFRYIDFSNLALGDIDQDGMDEIIELTDDHVNCYNYNGTICNGFPLSGSFYGNILIGNMIGDFFPEIIVRSEGVINFISYNGKISYQLSSEFTSNLYLVDFDDVYLSDGDRLIKSSLLNDTVNIYWGAPNGRFNNQPDVSGVHILDTYPLESTISVFYNYPNPTKENRTAFRFFISEAERADIKIFSSSGFLVKEISNLSFIENEYNEVYWDVSNEIPGLYLANLIIYDNGKESDSKFAKVLVSNE